jgi:hypothetical protein
VLTQPVSFADLYHRYANSWRVPPQQSLLSKDEKIERDIPKQPFYANNLNPDQYKRAREICTAAGVKEKSLLDACTFDVTVPGNETAAGVFVHARAPIAVMQPGSRPDP